MRALLVVLLLLGCGAGDIRPLVEVTVNVSGHLQGLSYLEATPSLSGEPSSERPLLVSRRFDQFVLRMRAPVLPALLNIQVDGLNSNGCVAAAGVGQLYVSGLGRYSVPVELGPAQGCRLEVDVVGAEGSVISDPPGIECGLTCGAPFAIGQRIALQARAGSDQFLNRWSGACSGASTCEVVIGRGTTRIGAQFTRSLCQNGWCLDTPILPRVHEVWGSGRDDIWLAADVGDAVIHWDGETYQAMSTGLSSEVLKIWGTGPADVWAVGPQGIARFDGSSWRPMVADRPLRGTDIHGLGPDDVWVAAPPDLLHWDGRSWRDFPELRTYTPPVSPYRVWAVGPEEVWLTEPEERIFRWDGKSFRQTLLQNGFLFSRITATSPRDGWAVGFAGGRLPTGLLHWNGEGWAPVTIELGEARQLTGLWVDQVGALWLGALGGLLLRYEPGSGSLTRLPTGGASGLNALWGSAPDDLWAVGREVVRWNGQTVRPLQEPISGGLNTIWGSNSHDIWAAGQGLLHYDGARWEPVPGISAVLLDLWGSASDDIWAVGERGVILHHDGSRWTRSATGVAARLNSVWGSGRRDVWAVGSTSDDKTGTSRVIVLHYDGTDWKTVPVQYGPDNQGELTGVWGLNAGDVWAMPGCLHFDGAMWSGKNPCGDYQRLWGRANELWAVGTRAYGRWDGRSWKEMPLVFEGFSIGGDSEQVWVLSSGLTQVQPELRPRIDLGSDYLFRDMWGTGSGERWAVGSSASGAAIVHYQR